MSDNHAGLIGQPADDRPRDLYAGAVLATFAPRAPRHRKARGPRWYPVAIGGLLLVSLFVLVGCGNSPSTPAPSSPASSVTMTPDDPGNAASPAQVFVADLRAAGMANPPSVGEVQADTELICSVFRSGAPMETEDQGIPTATYVHALNDAKLCGASPVTVPPTAWSTP